MPKMTLFGVFFALLTPTTPGAFGGQEPKKPLKTGHFGQFLTEKLDF